MIYDPKFQRSPFDPFGKPPRLHARTKTRNLSDSKSPGLASDGEEGGGARVAHVGKQMKSVPSLSSMSIASDLTEPVSLWGAGSGPVSPLYKSPTVESQWTFHLSPTKKDQSSLAEENSVASISSESFGSSHISPARSSIQTVGFSSTNRPIASSPLPAGGVQNGNKNLAIDERDHHDLASLRLEKQLQGSERSRSDVSLYQEVSVPVYTVLNPIEDILSSPSVRVTSYNSNAAQRLQNKSRGKAMAPRSSGGGGATALQNQSASGAQSAFIGGAEAHLYKNTFKCTYPHCHQVFSRAYTYKIHLRSHEMFPHYHDFKKKPQLVLDPDKKQVRDIGTQMYTRNVSLPPIVQSDLNSLR